MDDSQAPTFNYYFSLFAYFSSREPGVSVLLWLLLLTLRSSYLFTKTSLAGKLNWQQCSLRDRPGRDHLVSILRSAAAEVRAYHRKLDPARVAKSPFRLHERATCASSDTVDKFLDSLAEDIAADSGTFAGSLAIAGSQLELATNAWDLVESMLWPLGLGVKTKDGGIDDGETRAAGSNRQMTLTIVAVAGAAEMRGASARTVACVRETSPFYAFHSAKDFLRGVALQEEHPALSPAFTQLHLNSSQLDELAAIGISPKMTARWVQGHLCDAARDLPGAASAEALVAVRCVHSSAIASALGLPPELLATPRSFKGTIRDYMIHEEELCIACTPSRVVPVACVGAGDTPGEQQPEVKGPPAAAVFAEPALVAWSKAARSAKRTLRFKSDPASGQLEVTVRRWACGFPYDGPDWDATSSDFEGIPWLANPPTSAADCPICNERLDDVDPRGIVPCGGPTATKFGNYRCLQRVHYRCAADLAAARAPAGASPGIPGDARQVVPMAVEETSSEGKAEPDDATRSAAAMEKGSKQHDLLRAEGAWERRLGQRCCICGSGDRLPLSVPEEECDASAAGSGSADGLDEPDREGASTEPWEWRVCDAVGCDKRAHERCLHGRTSPEAQAATPLTAVLVNRFRASRWQCPQHATASGGAARCGWVRLEAGGGGGGGGGVQCAACRCHGDQPWHELVGISAVDYADIAETTPGARKAGTTGTAGAAGATGSGKKRRKRTKRRAGQAGQGGQAGPAGPAGQAGAGQAGAGQAAARQTAGNRARDANGGNEPVPDNEPDPARWTTSTIGRVNPKSKTYGSKDKYYYCRLCNTRARSKPEIQKHELDKEGCRAKAARRTTRNSRKPRKTTE